MKLSDWASMAEIVSGIAVVVTLAFLISGIRENTAITRAEMYSSHLESFNEMGRDIYRDAELTRLHDAWLSGDIASLNAQDIRRLARIVVNSFRTYEMAFYSQRYGLYGPDEWGRMERLICLNYQRGLGTDIESMVAETMTREFNEYTQVNCSAK